MTYWFVSIEDIEDPEAAYFGPFRSRKAAETFREKITPRIRRDDVYVDVCVLRKPLVRSLREDGWFGGERE